MQVWEDLRKTKHKQELFTKDAGADRLGPLGTTDKCAPDASSGSSCSAIRMPSVLDPDSEG